MKVNPFKKKPSSPFLIASTALKMLEIFQAVALGFSFVTVSYLLTEEKSAPTTSIMGFVLKLFFRLLNILNNYKMSFK